MRVITKWVDVCMFISSDIVENGTQQADFNSNLTSLNHRVEIKLKHSEDFLVLLLV